MNVACPQLNGFLEQIVDSPDNRRAARKVTQAIDIGVRLDCISIRLVLV